MALADRAVYATQPVQLEHQLDGLLAGAAPKPIEGEIVALVVPDSNRLAGGAVAAEAYGLLRGRDYENVILVSPSHHGPFERLSICRIDRYRTPLGDVPVNDRLRNELCDEDDDIFIDDQGHYHTEGADVQLPFLQKVLGGPDEPGFSVVPIVMGSEQPAFCRELGHAIGEVMYGKRVLVIASADLLSVEGHALDEF
ncbi:MAG: AmmeMemoRadiSam system protein B, partial [Rhodothermales bacterium]|nr:AmmeMemoRadiSam system protein B [Rhodothermales bacterium]